MHLLAGMAVYFIFFSVCYIFFFDETWKSKKCLDIPVLYKSFCSWFLQLILQLLSGLLFQKLLWLLAYFYVAAEVDNFGRIYVLDCSELIPTALMKLQQGIYISRSLIECMYSGYAQGTVRMYIYVLGMKGYDTADFRVSWAKKPLPKNGWINLKLSWICKSMENISLFHLFRVPWEDWPHPFLTMPTMAKFKEI